MGAESTDVPDEGRWYQLVPRLLGTAMRVEVTLVGMELDTTFASSAAPHAPAVRARAHRQTLSQFLADTSQSPADIAFVFHPGVQKHRAWLGRDGFPTLLDRGVPERARPFGGLVYRQALEHLHGVRDEATTRALIAQENRRYARRQLIWFRKEPNLIWFDGPGESSTTIEAVTRLVDSRHRPHS